jgi:biotin operon repressor
LRHPWNTDAGISRGESTLKEWYSLPGVLAGWNNGALEGAMVLRIIEILKEEPDISQEALADKIGSTRRIIQKYIKVLKESGRIERVGGKRYGHWEVR